MSLQTLTFIDNSDRVRAKLNRALVGGWDTSLQTLSKRVKSPVMSGLRTGSRPGFNPTEYPNNSANNKYSNRSKFKKSFSPDVIHSRRDVHKHHYFRITPQRILQQKGQFRVAIGYVGRFFVPQGINNVP